MHRAEVGGGPDRVNLVGEDPGMDKKSCPRPRTLSLQFQALDGGTNHWWVGSLSVFWVYPLELGEHRKVHLTLKISQDAFQQNISNQQSINKALFLIVLPLLSRGKIHTPAV